MKIDGIEISNDTRSYVVAEIGANHCGSIELCKMLFLEAKLAGADAVKLQKRENSVIFSKRMLESRYDSVNAYAETYGRHREILEFSKSQFVELKDYARKIGITFFATAFDEVSADFLNSIEMPAFKVSSFDLTNFPLLKKIASYNKPIILSTGGGSLEQIKKAVNFISYYNRDLAILQCTSSYPTERKDVNLSIIDLYKKEFPNVIVGYSGHDTELDITKFAIARGAKIIEKHFTLDKAWKGTDQSMSLISAELKQICEASKCFSKVYGVQKKELLESELPALKKMIKTVVASRSLTAGSVLNFEDLEIRSCGNFGITPDRICELVGKVLAVDVGAGESIKWESLE